MLWSASVRDYLEAEMSPLRERKSLAEEAADMGRAFSERGAEQRDPKQ